MNDDDKRQRVIEALNAGRIEDATLDKILADLPEREEPTTEAIHGSGTISLPRIRVRGVASVSVRLPLTSAVATLTRVAEGLRIRGEADADDRLLEWAQGVDGVKWALECTIRPGFGLTIDGTPLEARNPLLRITEHRRYVLEAMARRPMHYEWDRDALERESGESMRTVDRALVDGRKVGIVDEQSRMLTPNGYDWVQKAVGKGSSGS